MSILVKSQKLYLRMGIQNELKDWLEIEV